MEKSSIKSIKVSEEVYQRLNALVGIMREKERKPVSINTAILRILPRVSASKPSDFAGSWKMSEMEAQKLKNETRKLWKLWKR